MVQEQTGRISFEDILGIPAANMESIEPKKQSSSESVLPDPGAAENGQPPRQGVDNTVHRARRVSMWNVANLTVSFAKKLKKQTQRSESDVKAQVARVKERRMSQIGFEEVNPSELEFGGKIGEGAMGEVFQGKWNERDVAIKTFKGHEKPVDRASEFGRELCQELDVLYSVGHHPNVVSFFGAVTKSKPMLLLECVKGPTLENYLHGEIMPNSKAAVLHTNINIATIAGWTRDLLSGINFMHDREPCIIHRDLKPANLVLVPDLSQLKILDFGVGTMVNKRERLTRVMTMATGTNRYMAPEVAYANRNNNYTEKADIYSSALIIWEITTGRRPYDSEVETFNLMQENTREVARPFVEGMTQWPELGKLCEAAWAVVPEDRPSAKDLLEMLSSTPRCPPPGTPVSPLHYEKHRQRATCASKCCLM